MSEKKDALTLVVGALKDKKDKREAVKEKYKAKDKAKDKAKKLSTSERLDRIEEYLGLDE